MESGDGLREDQPRVRQLLRRTAGLGRLKGSPRYRDGLNVTLHDDLVRGPVAMEEATRSLRDQCAESGVPYFLKQLGGPTDKRGKDRAILEGRHWRAMPTG